MLPNSSYTAIVSLWQKACLSLCGGSVVPGLPSQSRYRSTAPPEGEPLAGRFTLSWTPEARYGTKGRALLPGAGASEQAHLVKLP